MKRYLFFQTLDSGFDLASPQFILCGNPRIAVLNPVSSAATFLWEQIEPDPIITPVTITPNNTSKNIVVVIPNSINRSIILKVTLNGDATNYKYVTIIPFLIDNVSYFSKGKVNLYNTNTLNDPVPLFLAPIPSLGPQVIKYTSSSQLTGVRFKSQDYRLGYTKGITLNSPNLSTYIPFINNIYQSVPEIRVQLNTNTKFTLLKDWTGIPVFSQEIIPVDTIINMSYPTFIADDYISSISKGNVNASFTRTPYLVSNFNQLEFINASFSKGGVNVGFTRTPYLVANYNQSESVSNSFSKGGVNASFTRTPYTSNIVG